MGFPRKMQFKNQTCYIYLLVFQTKLVDYLLPEFSFYYIVLMPIDALSSVTPPSKISYATVSREDHVDTSLVVY